MDGLICIAACKTIYTLPHSTAACLLAVRVVYTGFRSDALIVLKRAAEMTRALLNIGQQFRQNAVEV